MIPVNSSPRTSSNTALSREEPILKTVKPLPRKQPGVISRGSTESAMEFGDFLFGLLHRFSLGFLSFKWKRRWSGLSQSEPRSLKNGGVAAELAFHNKPSMSRISSVYLDVRNTARDTNLDFEAIHELTPRILAEEIVGI